MKSKQRSVAAKFIKVLQRTLKALPAGDLDPGAEADLRQYTALGTRVLLAFQKLALSQERVLSPIQQMESALAILAETFNYPLVFVEQYDATAECLTLVAAHGVRLPTEQSIVTTQGQTLSGTVVTTQKPLVWAEASDPLTLPQLVHLEVFADQFQTVVSLPLHHQQEVVGVLTFAHPEYQSVEAYVLQWLGSLAAPVAAVLAECQMVQQLSLWEKRLDFAALGLQGVIYDLDLQQRQVIRTGNLVHLLGYDEAEVFPSLAWWLNRVHPEDRGRLETFLEQDSHVQREFDLLYRVRRANLQYVVLRDRGIVVRDASGQAVRLVGTLLEHTPVLTPTEVQIPLEQPEAIAEVPASAVSALSATSVPQYPSVLERLQDVIFQTDVEGCWTYLNSAWVKLTGFSVEESLGQCWRDFVHPEDGAIHQQAFQAVIGQQPEADYPQLRYLTQDGQIRWVEVHCQPILDANGLVSGTTGILYDITDRKSVETQLLHDVMHDSLTGLPNRVLFTNRLQHSFQNHQRYPEAGFAVLFIDLDRFKVINDSLGHIAGDELLKSVAVRLQQCLRPGDTVARFGGDEFTVLLPQVTEAAVAIQVSQRILYQLSQPFTLFSQPIYTSGSVGIALSTGSDQQPDELLRNADIALYRAKANGKGRYELFVPTMYADAREQLELENDLRRAMEQQEMVLYYQPIFSLPDRGVVGFEALLRWNHPKQGLLDFEQFLPLAEETGLATSIGWWMMKAAITQLYHWQMQYPWATDLFIAVNLFGQQVDTDDFVQQVEQSLRATPLPVHCLMLEVSQRLLTHNPQRLLEHLQPLRGLGVQICLNAFGRQFSSFGDLSNLPLSHLKIDAAFVSELETGTNLEVVSSILELGHQLSLRVIAEGIARNTHVAQLQAMKCDYGQGRFLAPSALPDALTPLFEQQSLAPSSSMGISSATFPTLIVRTVNGETSIPLVKSRSWSIGRSSESTVVLSDRWVSRNHAEIQCLDRQDYYLVDLGSGNGSFVNGQRVTLPVLLKDGDLLTIGRTEMEFQFASAEIPTQLQAAQVPEQPLPQASSIRLQEPLPKSILMMQASHRQGEIWRVALESQGVTFAKVDPEVDLKRWIEARVQSRKALPDLLLVDMTALRPNPYSFCRWCHGEYPQLKIVLTSGIRTEVPPSERQWALHQGATDLLSAFPEENLFSNLVDIVGKVKRLLQALDVSPSSQQSLQSLASALKSIQSQAFNPDTVIGANDSQL